MSKHFALLALLALPALASADDWPQFLGPQRTGISAEKGLLSEWPAGGPPVLWRAEGGVGMSGVSVVGKKAVTLVQSGGRQRLIALDVGSGKPRWSADLGPEYGNQMGDGPRGTAAIADGSAYVYTGDGVLVAIRMSDGGELWRRAVVREKRARIADYGMACSPLVAGDLVIVIAGAPGATLAAYQRATGEPAWSAGDDSAGYSSPTLLTLDGRAQVVSFTGKSVIGVDPKSGELLWRYPYVTDYDCNIATPIAVDGNIFISCGENHGATMLALERQDGRLAPQVVWASTGPGSVLRNEWQTSVLLDGHLYGLDNVGSAGPVTHLTCVDAKTGQRVWREPRFGKSNLIAADGKLLLSTMKGELVVARASPDGYQEIGRMQVLGKTRQAPSLADGRLYLRDDREVVCVDMR